MTGVLTIQGVLTVLGTLVALGSAALTLARPAQGAGSPAVQLAAFTPLGLLGWPVAAVLFLLASLWWAAGLSLALVAVHLIWFAGPTLANPVGPAGPGTEGHRDDAPTLRVLTLNCLLGRANAAQIVNLAGTERVDVLLLEELTAGLAARLHAAGIDAVLGHHELHPRPGGMGTGIWSRLPLHPLGVLGADAPAMPQVVLEVPGAGPVTVTAVHTHPPLWRVVGRWRRQMTMLTELTGVVHRGAPVPQGPLSHRGTPGPAGHPQILAGDFNATRDHREFRALLAARGLVDTAESVGPAGALAPRFTWPADKPWPALTRLDHILVSAASIAVESHAVVAVEGSDHHGLIATLRFR